MKTAKFDWNDVARRARRPLLGPRIATVVSASPEEFAEQTHVWFLHLNKVVQFPFDARVCYGASDFAQGTRLQVLALVDHNEFSGVIAKAGYSLE